MFVIFIYILGDIIITQYSRITVIKTSKHNLFLTYWAQTKCLVRRCDSMSWPGDFFWHLRSHFRNAGKIILGALEISLKDSFLLKLSEKDKVAPDRAIETAKVKETIKQVKCHKSPGKAAKICWRSQILLKEFVLCFHILHISVKTIPVSLISSLCWRHQPLQHMTKRKNLMNYISQRPTVLQIYSINLHVVTGVLVANQAVKILDYKTVLGNTDFTLFSTICQSCNGYHQKQLLSFPFQAQTTLSLECTLSLHWNQRISVFGT